MTEIPSDQLSLKVEDMGAFRFQLPLCKVEEAPKPEDCCNCGMQTYHIRSQLQCLGYDAPSQITETIICPKHGARAVTVSRE